MNNTATAATHHQDSWLDSLAVNGGLKTELSSCKDEIFSKLKVSNQTQAHSLLFTMR